MGDPAQVTRFNPIDTARNDHAAERTRSQMTEIILIDTVRTAEKQFEPMRAVLSPEEYMAAFDTVLRMRLSARLQRPASKGS